jgi:hypothetical protein
VRKASTTSRRRLRAADDGCDLVVGNVEHVVQHEGESLRGRERLQHDEQREADGVGEQRLLLGVDGDVVGGCGRAGRPRVERRLAPRAA